MIRRMNYLVAAIFLACFYGFRSASASGLGQLSKSLCRLRFDGACIATIIFLTATAFSFDRYVIGQIISNSFQQNAQLNQSSNYSSGIPTNTHDVTITTSFPGLSFTNNVIMRSIAVANGNAYEVSTASSSTRYLILGNNAAHQRPENLINLKNNSTFSIVAFPLGGLSLVSHGNLNVESGSTLNIASVISSSTGVGVRKTGAGTATFSNSNVYGGPTEINGGTLAIAHASALGSAGLISFGGGTLRYDLTPTTDLSGRFSNVANQAYSINTNGNAVIFASNLTSSGGTLTKLGAGTLTLTGTGNTYSGGTTVSAGVLVLSNSLANQRFTVAEGATLTSSATLNGTGINTINGHVNSQFNLQTGATLKGTGTIAGNVAIVDATLAVGNSIGTMTITGDLSFTAGSTFEVDIDTENPTSSDLLAVSGLLKLNSAQLSLVDFSASNTGVAIGSIYTFANFGTVQGTFAGLSEGTQFSLLGNEWKISYGVSKPGSITLTVVAVPEPSGFLLIVSFFAIGFLQRRAISP